MTVAKDDPRKKLAIADCRPQVIAFALLMERELRNNDHKRGWKEDSAYALADHMVKEAIELKNEMPRGHYIPEWREATPEEAEDPGRRKMVQSRDGVHKVLVADRLVYVPDERWRVHIASEAADLANMAMMVADVCGCLEVTA